MAFGNPNCTKKKELVPMRFVKWFVNKTGLIWDRGVPIVAHDKLKSAFQITMPEIFYAFIIETFLVFVLGAGYQMIVGNFLFRNLTSFS